MHSPYYFAFAGWLLGWILLRRVPRLPRGPVALPPAPIAVVVPARNEAGRLPDLLAGLCVDLPENVRVLVVDDHSTDGTAEAAARFPGVTVLQAPPLPEGWRGKTWACQVGAEAARGAELLVFLDADVRVRPAGLARALAAHAEVGGLLSVWPYHDVRRPYEHLSALFNVASLMVTGAGSAVPPKVPREALGPFLVTSAADYRRVGGFRAVRAEIVEDLALGHAYAAAGLPVGVRVGDDDVSFRMYTDGYAGMVDGWLKSFGLGATFVALPRVLGIVLWLVASIGSITWAGGVPKPGSLVLTSLFVLQMWAMFRQVGRFGLLDALLYPVHVTFLTVVTVVGLFRARVMRRVRWRGRELSVPPAAAGSAPPEAPASGAVEPAPDSRGDRG